MGSKILEKALGRVIPALRDYRPIVHLSYHHSEKRDSLHINEN